LESKSFEVFLPKVRVWSRWKDRWKRVEKSLFPGYLFIHTPLTHEDNLEILKTRGVVKVLGRDSNRATPVPDEEINSIKLLLRAESEIESHPYLKIGQRVRVIDGPFQGVVGKVQEFRGRRRLVVTVELLARSVSVVLENGDVVRACS
jgi:transcription antitermination factor NusG